MKVCLIFSLLWSVTNVFSQGLENADANQVFSEFSKVSDVYMKQGYSLSYKRVIYRNASDSEPMMSDIGVIARGRNSEYRSQSSGNLTIQNNDLKVVVDSVQRLVSIFKTDTLFQSVDLQKFMDKSVSSRYTFKRELLGVNVHYILIPKNEAEGTTEIWFHKTDFTISKIEMLLPRANYFSESLDDVTLETPKLIMTYDKPKQIDLNKSTLFDVSSILQKKDNTWLLLPSAAGFTLHDSRITTK